MEEQKFSYTTGFTFENCLRLFSKIDTNLSFSGKKWRNPDSTKNAQKDMHCDAHSNIDVIASKWKQSKCPKIDWINKL